MKLKEGESLFSPVGNGSPDITAIIPVFNRPRDLQKLLISFKILNYSGKLTVIIVDDASTDDYFAIYEEF